MYKSAALCFALLFTSPQITATELNTKEALVQQILKAQGILEVLEEQNRKMDEALKAQAQQLQNQILAGRGSAEVQGSLELFNKYFNSADWLIPADKIMAKWAEAYGQNMTEADLKKALAYYVSPVGQREAAANKQVSSMMSNWIMQETQVRADKIFVDYMRGMQALLNPPLEQGQ